MAIDFRNQLIGKWIDLKMKDGRWPYCIIAKVAPAKNRKCYHVVAQRVTDFDRACTVDARRIRGRCYDPPPK